MLSDEGIAERWNSDSFSYTFGIGDDMNFEMVEVVGWW